MLQEEVFILVPGSEETICRGDELSVWWQEHVTSICYVALASRELTAAPPQKAPAPPGSKSPTTFQGSTENQVCKFKICGGNLKFKL